MHGINSATALATEYTYLHIVLDEFCRSKAFLVLSMEEKGICSQR